MRRSERRDVGSIPTPAARHHGPVVQRQRLLSYKQETMVQLHPGLLAKGEGGVWKGEYMLSFHTPPSAFPLIHVLVEQPGVLACLSRRRSWVQIPSGTLGK
jgi:hypothetical protein